MSHRVPRWMFWLGAVLVAVVLLSPMAQAQERGQYIPGFQGLNSGYQAPPGFTYMNYFIWYPTSTFKGPNGEKLPLSFNLDLIVDFNVAAYTTKKKFLGANYGFAIAVPIVNQAVDLPVLGTGSSPMGIGDIYVEPINLGWTTKGQTHVKLAYGFVAPTGRYDPPTNTTTTDFWGHQLTFAVTHPFTKTKLWQVSASQVWEFHQGKRHSDITVGDNVTFEYGVGKTWVKNQGKQLIQFGGIGYAEFQLANDTGSAAPPPPLRFKDRVFAMGPEFGVILPQKRFNFLVRVLPEFGARSRTQGLTFVAAVGKTWGGLPPPPPTASCSAEPTEVMAGEPVRVTAAAHFPKDRPLTYAWSASGGTVSGTESVGTVETAGLAPGSYKVTAHVVDNKKESADCSASFAVKEPPKNPPRLSCSANPTTVRSGEASTISCSCSSPDNRSPLTFAWTTNAGTLSGSGASEVLDTAGLPSGPVSVGTTCTDDRGLSDATSTTVNVEAPPPAPQPSKLGECDFKTARVDNKCKAILDDVALRLQRDADSKAVLVGQADSQERTAAKLAQQRADNSKQYLVKEKGIDPSRIETRVGSAGGRRVEMVIVPPGASY